jgi:hypothetical protein
MKLDDLKFWVSPLSNTLFVGTTSKRDPLEVLQKRDVTGLVINGVVEVMRARGLPYVEVTQEGKRYRLSLDEVVPPKEVAQS